jgi:hypothetical protein
MARSTRQRNAWTLSLLDIGQDVITSWRWALVQVR